MSDVLRGLNATVGAQSTISNDATEMGEDLFNAGSVFSYFSPQSKTEHGLFGPEFQIYSTQTAADRVNLVDSILYGTKATGFKVDLTPFVNQATDTTTLLNYISSIFLHGAMSSDLEAAATTAVKFGDHANGESAGGALRRPHLQRISNHSVKESKNVFT